MVEQAMAIATPERLRHAGEEGVEVVPAMRDRDRPEQITPLQPKVVSAPLDRMWKDGRITQEEFNAGDRYRSDAYLAAVDPGAGTVDWNRAGSGGNGSRVPSVFSAQVVADARMRWRDSNRAMSELTRIVLAHALIDEHKLEEIGQAVFGFRNHRDAAASGQAAVRMALSGLARHYDGA